MKTSTIRMKELKLLEILTDFPRTLTFNQLFNKIASRKYYQRFFFRYFDYFFMCVCLFLLSNDVDNVNYTLADVIIEIFNMNDSTEL